MKTKIIHLITFFLVISSIFSQEYKLYGSGGNEFGQLGFSSTLTKYNFELINEGEWIKIFSDGSTIFGIKKDSTLWAWGSNYRGTFGNGEIEVLVNHIPELVSNDFWFSISSYFSGFTLGIKGDSTLWAWGSNSRGQLGTGDLENYYRPIQIDTNKWIKVFAGAYACFALKSDSTLWGWGSNGNGMVNNGKTSGPVLKPEKINNFKWIELSGGSGQIMGIREDGTLWGWGQGPNGELGKGTNSYKEPTLINDQKWLKISCRTGSSFAIKSDGTLWATGGFVKKYFPTERYYVFNQISTEVWNDVYVSSSKSVFCTKTDGTLWVIGNNDRGQLGIGENAEYNEFEQLEIDGELKQIVTSYQNTFLLIDNTKNYSDEKIIYDFSNVISTNDSITHNYYSDTLQFTYNTNSELILSDNINEFEIELFYDKYHFFPIIDEIKFVSQNDSLNKNIIEIDENINKLTIRNLTSSTFSFNDLVLIKGILLANSDSVSYFNTNIFYKNSDVSNIKITDIKHKIISRGKTWVTDNLLSKQYLKIQNVIVNNNSLELEYQSNNTDNLINIKIFDNLGNNLHDSEINVFNNEINKFNLNISNYTSGVYFVMLSQNGLNSNISFLKVQ